MDDRTIIDDKSERVTDPMDAKPGDLLVLGYTEGGSFKQKVWGTVDSVEKSNYGLFLGSMPVSEGGCKNDIKVSGLPYVFVVSPGANRTENPIEVFPLNAVNGKLQSTELYFDCLIRPFEPFKRGIYKFSNDYGSSYYYFDGKGTYVDLNSFGGVCCPAPEEKMNQILFPRSCFSLVLPIDDEKDDDGKKDI